VSTVQLLQSPVDQTLAEEAHSDFGHVHPDWDLGATVRKMSDYNLTEAPVLDEQHRSILGVITVDDVLELLMPSGWRRDFGMTAADE
jgi:Mg/Co/Ni transporter MgtE